MNKNIFVQQNAAAYFKQLSITDHRDVEVLRAPGREECDGALRLAAVVVQPLHHAVRAEEVVGTLARRNRLRSSLSLQESSHRRHQFYGQRNRPPHLSTIFWHSTQDRRRFNCTEYSTVDRTCAWVRSLDRWIRQKLKMTETRFGWKILRMKKDR